MSGLRRRVWLFWILVMLTVSCAPILKPVAVALEPTPAPVCAPVADDEGLFVPAGVPDTLPICIERPDKIRGTADPCIDVHLLRALIGQLTATN